jgi:hypothetical protein
MAAFSEQYSVAGAVMRSITEHCSLNNADQKLKKKLSGFFFCHIIFILYICTFKNNK